MALTGYRRYCSCVEYQDDEGSYHICIDASSASRGNFCTVPGQSDWCSTYMMCDTDNHSNVENYEDEESDKKIMMAMITVTILILFRIGVFAHGNLHPIYNKLVDAIIFKILNADCIL